MVLKKGLALVLVAGVLAVGVPGAAMVAADGPLGIDFRISNQSVDAVSPAVAYNPQRQEYLVVWYNDRAGNDDIQAQRLRANGSLVGGDFFIAAGSGAERRCPDVTYNSQRNEYLVVWEHCDAGSGCSIRARRVSATGLPLEPPEIVVRSSGYNLYTPSVPAVAYASTADKYLVVWQETWHPSPLSHSIVGQVLSSSGTLQGSDFYVSQDPGDGSYRRAPDLAYNRSRNEYLVAWQQRDPGAGDYDIYARRVRGNGTPMSPASIEIWWGGEDQLAPAVAAIPTTPNQGRYVVVWEDHALPSDVDIHARRVSGEGNPLDASYKTVASSTEDETCPAVAGSETAGGFLITWTRFLTDPQAPWAHWELIHGRVLGVGGNFRGGESQTGGVYDADHSAVSVGRAGDFLVVFEDAPLMSTSRDIYGRLWGDRVYTPLLVKRHS
jgi:hypothetical protein